MSDPAAATTVRAAPGAGHAWLVLGVVCLGMLTASVDGSALNVTYPLLATTFETSAAGIGWVALANMVTSVTGLAIFGRLADVVGRKRVYVCGIVVFLLGSLLAGTAQSLAWLIGARVVSGLGTSMVIANSIALIGAAVPGNRRGTAIGMLETTVALGMASGPIIGGQAADAFGWRAVFFLSWPVGLTAAVLSVLVLREAPRQGRAARFDFLGAALFAAGMVSALLGLTNGATLGWGSPWVLGGLALGATLLALFAWVEQRVPNPMIALSLFRNPVFAAANAAKIACYLAIMAGLFLAPFYFQRALGFTAGETGRAMLPFPIALSLASLTMGPLSDRIGWRVIAPTGMVVGAVGCWLVAQIQPAGGLAVAFGAFLVMILGLASFISPNDSAIVGAAPPDQLGVASGILAVTRSLGMIVGIAVAGTLLASREPAYVAAGLDETAAFVAAFHDVFLVAAAASLLGALASLVGGGKHPAVNPGAAGSEA